MLPASESWLFLFLLSRRPVEFWSLSGNRRNPPGGKPQTHGESDSFSSMTVQTTYDSYWISSLGRRYVCRPYYVISCPSAAYKSLTQMKREKNNGNLWNIFPSTKTQNSALPCNNWMWSLISVLCRIPIKTHPSSSISQWVRPVSTVDVFIYLCQEKRMKKKQRCLPVTR